MLVKKDVFCVMQSGKFLKKCHFAGSDCFKWLETSYIVKLRLTEPNLDHISAFGHENAKCHNAQYDCPTVHTHSHTHTLTLTLMHVNK